MNLEKVLIFIYQLSQRTHMLINMIEFILTTFILYIIVTIALPAIIAKAVFNQQNTDSKIKLDKTFDNIILITNDHTFLNNLSAKTLQAKRIQLRRIANDSTDIYFNKKISMENRYQKLIKYQQILLKIKEAPEKVFSSASYVNHEG